MRWRVASYDRSSPTGRSLSRTDLLRPNSSSRPTDTSALDRSEFGLRVAQTTSVVWFTAIGCLAMAEALHLIDQCAPANLDGPVPMWTHRSDATAAL